MSALTKDQCEPCRGGVPQVDEVEMASLMKDVPDWAVKERGGVKMLERAFKLKNYKRAVAFANQIADLAEEQGHHPEILLEWGKVTVTWWTHAISGLHRNDFICAAKSDALFEAGGD